ncbi:MFS transporter [Desulfofustis glycolicus]|uniref:MFS transporter, DHA1 family, multidrug resistance protein n=1 Tax=Desulfofustis glycolicus DSM 9705 TaxID=1121409 RepID=A0A1M5YE62_9BACT|nr:MFS transporter [Desulfofustis glycolicus]MCB2216900.1 MFS transporter [Desulfobulbaceae bacterium]SHI10350.1 MFS transporter, DHA1 family, multidrug resistance protein [Desulfofustis glycolicus DSM 9705]
MFVVQMISVVGFACIMPFLPLYVHALGTVTFMSESLCTALVYSGQALTMMIASPLWGYLADRYGRKVMVERATFGGALVLLLMAFPRSAEELVLLRMLQGGISGILGAANALVAASVPRSKSGFAMGLMQVSMGVGFALGPLLGGVLADLFGYQSVFYFTAPLLFMAGVLVWRFVDEQFVPRKIEGKKSINIFSAWKRVSRAPGVGLLFLLRFINQSGRIIYFPILPLFLLTLIDNPEKINSYTGIVISVASVSTALFSVLIGRLGDRSTHQKMVLFCLFGAGVVFVLQSLVQTGWQLIILQLFYGIALGGVITSISAMLALFSEEGDEGTVYGLDSSVNAGARMVGPLLCYAITSLFGMRMVFAFAGALYLLATILALSLLPKNKPFNS